MAKNSRDPVHGWLVLGKAFRAAAKYLYAGLAEKGIDDTDFRILEVLLNKGPLPVNTIGPKNALFLPVADNSGKLSRCDTACTTNSLTKWTIWAKHELPEFDFALVLRKAFDFSIYDFAG